MKAKKLLSSLLIIPLGSFVPMLSSCGSNGIVFANYESYMDDSLMSKLSKQYGATFLPYETNEEIENKFERYYDVAVPSTYEAIALKQKNLITKLDWTKFGIKGISNGVQARESNQVFSDAVRTLIEKLDKYYQDLSILELDESVLDYGIPYFLQSFDFAYKGDEISSIDSCQSWTDLVKQINSNNPNLDPRFTPYKERKIAMVEDSRSLFGISKLIYDGKGVNPEEDEQSKSYFESVYSKFFNNFNKGYTYLNTDSGQIISTLCKHYPNGCSSAVAYNGDLLYAAQGGGLYDATDASQFHFCGFKETLIALDMMVINKKDVGTNKEQKIYDMIKDIGLSGYDATKPEDFINPNDGSYKYDSALNFSFVQYTSPLKSICNWVMKKYDENDYDGYFSGYSKDQVELYQKIYDIKADDIDVQCIEQKMKNELAKSNMHWAFSNIKQNL